ncbi:MAG: winged helix-turn-helix domain-containing protein [Thermoplasmatales archaeon]|nr:winged helix-turn-helix domain-containing protein [Thermoplasmatales archaeon]
MNQLREDITEEPWTTDEVMKHIKSRFDVDYTLRQVSRILKKFGMHHAKPYPHDYGRPKDAEEKLKKLTPDILKDEVVGFTDQSSPRTTANT